MENKLRRTIGEEKMLFGVCGGIAKYFGLDATLIRMIWAVATIFGLGSPIIIYLIMMVIMPKEGQI